MSRESITKFIYSALIILVALYLVGIGCKKTEKPTPAPTNKDETPLPKPTNSETFIPQNGTGDETGIDGETGEETINVKTLLSAAEKFAEILGTYTNKDNYANIESSKNYTTEGMKNWLEALKKPVDPDAPFYGRTTQALSSSVLEITESTAKVLVTSKREEITAQTKTPNVIYQMIIVDFVKEDGSWKVNGAWWL